MEEAKGGTCTSCGGEFPSLNAEGKCEGCAGGGKAATGGNPGEKAPADPAPETPADPAPEAPADPAPEAPAE